MHAEEEESPINKSPLFHPSSFSHGGVRGKGGGGDDEYCILHGDDDDDDA